jgi:hypothetical protein
MIWAGILTSSAWLGYELAGLLSPAYWDSLTIISCGVPLGFTISSWGFLFLRQFRPLDSVTGRLTTIFMLVVSACLHYVNPKPIRLRRLRPEFCTLLAFLFLLYYKLTDMAILKDGTSSAGTSYSDLPFHLSLVSSFAYGANSGTAGFQTPFYLGEKLCYPFIPDFHSSVLASCGGASLRVSIAVPTMLLLLSITIAIHTLAVQFTDRRFAPEIAIVTWLLASGVGWRYFFVPECRANVNANMAHCFCTDVYTFWIHSLIHYVFPQRSGIFSTPLNVLIVSLLIDIVETGFTDKRAALLAGVLMGLLPMLSAHSYIGVGEYAIFLCLAVFPYRKTSLWPAQIVIWGSYGLSALAISLPQIFWLMRAKRENFMQLNPIHRETDSRWVRGVVTVWWGSLGSFVIVALFFVFFAHDGRQNLFYLPSLGVWIISNLLRYQPGAMDNTKVFFAGWYTLACIAVANYIVAAWRHGRAIVHVCLAVVMLGYCFGGSICIAKAAFRPSTMFSKDERDIGIWVMQNAKRDVGVLAGGWHGNTLMSLAGKLVTMGYGGWVWTHGLSLDARRKLMSFLVANRDNVTHFAKYNIEYAIWKSDDAKRGFDFPDPSPKSRWMLLFSLGHLKIYRILKT